MGHTFRRRSYWKYCCYLCICCLYGCLKHDVTLIEHQPAPAVVVPTTLPSDEIILCTDPELKKYQVQVYRDAKSRYKRFVALMYKSRMSKGNLEVEYRPGEFTLIQDFPPFFRSFKSYDVILYIDNPAGIDIKADGRFWYFKGQVYKDGTLNVNVRDAIYHDD